MAHPLSSVYERHNLSRENLMLWSNPKGWTDEKQMLQVFLGGCQNEDAGS